MFFGVFSQVEEKGFEYKNSMDKLNFRNVKSESENCYAATQVEDLKVLGEVATILHPAS